MAKVKIAFDLDGVIIDKPPFVPKRVIELLFKGHTGSQLHYRFPKFKAEQLIRKLSHLYLFRPPIESNLEFIKLLARDSRYELYVVSARYSFLKSETDLWLKKRKIENFFKKIYLNLGNEQPHLFKEKVLKKLKVAIFVDDDTLLADYLVEKLKGTRVYCFSRFKSCQKAKNVQCLGEHLL